MSDEYQVRYLEHMARKSEGLSINDDVERLKKVKDGLTHLVYLMESRRSQRKFNKEPLSENEVDLLLQAAVLAPSSCNRQAIYFVKGNEFLLNEILVGGKNWIRNADQVWLVMGAKEAYKNPAEQGFMPYLDAGFVCENVYLMAEALDIGCCFVNPHIRDDDKSVFVEAYGDDYFCGALVLGNYNVKQERPPIRERKEMLKNDDIYNRL